MAGLSNASVSSPAGTSSTEVLMIWTPIYCVIDRARALSMAAVSSMSLALS